MVSGIKITLIFVRDFIHFNPYNYGGISLMILIDKVAVSLPSALCF